MPISTTSTRTTPRRTRAGKLVKPARLAECRFPRTVYHISWDAPLRRWIVRVGRMVIDAKFETKADAIEAYRQKADLLWLLDGVPCQLRVQDKATGRFSVEATYGLDRSPPKG